MEPTGEAQERETPTHLETHENVRVGGERAYVARGKRYRTKWGQMASASGRPMFHQERREISQVSHQSGRPKIFKKK